MDLQKIGAFLAELRRQRGLTQEQLGQELGVTNKTVSRWENGNYLPPVQMLQALSALYGVGINEILSGERIPEENYRAKAEENIQAVISSSFTLKERMDYFKSKWRKEHGFEFVLGMLAVAAFYALGVLWNNGFQIVGYLFCVGFLIWERNRMMAYVEDRAFDGSGAQ